MSVYTEVPAGELRAFLHDYAAGELQEFAGIREGIENTNYFVTTHSGTYVLTLFEHASEAGIIPALDCMARFAGQGLPCARPLSNKQGRFLGHLHHKPASLVTRLRGRSVHKPAVEHCRAVGHVLARLHHAGRAIDASLENPHGAQWRHATAKRLRHHLDEQQLALLDDELGYQQQSPAVDLPRGLIHADLFRDNVLFDGTEVTGLLDLYNAGEGLLLYDLAITVTDWCTLPSGEFDTPRLHALLQAYTERRPVMPAEQQTWPVLLRRAALRFWLSRLCNLHFPRKGRLTQQKDPAVYQQLLHYYRDNPSKWPG